MARKEVRMGAVLSGRERTKCVVLGGRSSTRWRKEPGISAVQQNGERERVMSDMVPEF